MPNIVIGGQKLETDPRMAIARQLMAKGQESGPTDIFGGLNRALSQILGAKQARDLQNEYSAKQGIADETMKNAYATALGSPASQTTLSNGETINWKEQAPDPMRAAQNLINNPDTRNVGISFYEDQAAQNQKNAEFEREANLKRELAALRAGGGGGDLSLGVNPETGQMEVIQSTAPRKLSATEQKNFYEAQDVTDAIKNALGTLEQVQSIPKDKMYTGFGSSAEAFMNRVPGIGKYIDDEKAANTTTYDNLLKELAYSRLKSTFPGAISNSEREALERLQALSSYSQPEQEKIISEARKVLQRQYETASARKQGIVTGDIYNSDAALSAAPSAAPADSIRTNLQAGGFPQERIDAYLKSKGY